MSVKIAVTPSLENYIEVLYELNERDARVRVTDLAQKLGIAKSSVNQAVKLLVKHGLALHANYGPVELTQKGVDYACVLMKRHTILKTFFADVLGVDPGIADKDACIIEHVISPATIAKLTDYLASHEELAAEDKTETETAPRQIITLDRLVPGISARVVRITAKGAVKRRIQDMGIMQNSEIRVQKKAPTGDPIEVKVKDYSLALRGSEANDIIVEILEETEPTP